jgi:ankyrin repeat protein
LILAFTFVSLLASSASSLGGGDWSETESARKFREGDLEGVKQMLGDGDFSGEMLIDALELALLSGNVELVKYLADRGWLEKCRAEHRCEAIYSAAASGSGGLVEFLLSKGFTPNSLALSTAAKNGHFAVVEILCRGGGDLDQPIRYSARSAPVLEEAKKKSGYPHFFYDDILRDARMRAGIAKSIDYIESGRCKTASRQPTSAGQEYELEVNAFRKGDLQAVRNILTRSSAPRDPRVEVNELYQAILSQHIPLLQYLAGLGWMERCRGLAYCRPLHLAASAGVSNEVLEYLVSERFDANAYDTDYHKRTPLDYAAVAGDLERVKFFCEQGAGAQIGGPSKSKVLDRVLVKYDKAWCVLDPGIYSSCSGEEGSGRLEKPCRPGRPCGGHPFPPSGPVEEVRPLVALNKVYQYLSSGQCGALNAIKVPPKSR